MLTEIISIESGEEVAEDSGGTELSDVDVSDEYLLPVCPEGHDHIRCNYTGYSLCYRESYEQAPKTNPDAKLIETVESIPELRKSIKIGGTNSFGTGGMETKIQAAEKVTEYGIELLLANGGKPKSLAALYEENATGTLFLAE